MRFLAKTSTKSDSSLDPVALVRRIAACFTTPLSGSFRRVSTLDEYDKLISLPFDPSSYTDAWTFSQDYLLRNVLAKYNDGSADKEALDGPTFEKFLKVDGELANVNHRLRNISEDDQYLRDREVWTTLCRAAHEILKLLGPVPSSSITNLCEFTTGASYTRTRRSGCSASHKYGEQSPDVTFNCYDFGYAAVASSNLWFANVSDIRTVGGNRITTVPKNRTINRTIAIEPSLNMFIQRGIGNYLRRRLKSAGINLDDQTINQNLAKQGSVDGSLATIDLSSASDCVSLGIIEFLFPPMWVTLLKATRSPYGILPNGTRLTYNKLSSMGNGYTFEIESLIFWSICKALCSDEPFSIYGDDIIIPSHHVAALEKVLTFIGFKFNEQKSFSSGPFRESCGKHYFRGEDVSPFFHRRPGVNRKGRIFETIKLANNIRRFIGRTDHHELWVVYDWVVSHLPDFWQKPKIPEGVGDGALTGTLVECNPNLGFYAGVGPCYSATVITRVVVEAGVDPGIGAYFNSLDRECDRDHICDLINNRSLSIQFRLKELISRFKNLEAVSPELKEPDGFKYRQGRIRIWQWSDPTSRIGG